jgi:hypothetical protein
VRPETVEYIIKKNYRAHARDEPREREKESERSLAQIAATGNKKEKRE